jgi:hypothetical protein
MKLAQNSPAIETQMSAHDDSSFGDTLLPGVDKSGESTLKKIDCLQMTLKGNELTFSLIKPLIFPITLDVTFVQTDGFV